MSQPQDPSTPPPKVPPPMVLDDQGLYVMRDQTDVLRVAKNLLDTKAVPSTFTNAQQVAVAVQSLKSLGLNPYASIRQSGFINGAFTLWGDLPLAIVRASGALEVFEEFTFCLADDVRYARQCFDESNCHLDAFGAVCRVTRAGQPRHEVVFTESQAKAAGLWQKTPTWRNYPGRMMKMRARSQALKDVFSDVLAGVAIREYDGEGNDEQGHDGAPPPRPGRAAAPASNGRPKLARIVVGGEDDAPAPPPAAPPAPPEPAEAAVYGSRAEALAAKIRGGGR